MAIGETAIKKKIGLQVVCIAMIMIGLLGCFLPLQDAQQQPKAANGVMDLTTWNLAGSGTIKLDGEWEFYWMELLEPSDFLEGKKPTSDNFFSVANCIIKLN